MPNVFIIAGSNGSGKTTSAFKLIPNFLNIKEFVNADIIAQVYQLLTLNRFL